MYPDAAFDPNLGPDVACGQARAVFGTALLLPTVTGPPDVHPREAVIGRGMPAISHDLRSLPNLITLSRIALLAVAALSYFYVSRGVAIGLAVVAGVTDYLDGAVARRTGQVTRLGEILDQFSDLCFESLALTVAVAEGFFPPVVLLIYLFREFWVASIRRFSAEHRLNIPSSLWGKAKTNILMWTFLPAFISIGGFWPYLEPWPTHVARALLAIGLVVSYISAWGYTRAFGRGYGAV